MLLKLLLVAASALLSSLVAKRFGHAVGGTLAGLPMIAGPIMGFVLWATPVEGVRAIALATLVCLPATVAHLVTFAWSGTRWPWWLSLALANLAFFGLGMLMPQLGLPAWLVCLLALAVLALGGVYLCGGIAPRILGTLRAGAFSRGFLAKGRHRELLAGVPVWVVTNTESGLLGASVAAGRMA